MLAVVGIYWVITFDLNRAGTRQMYQLYNLVGIFYKCETWALFSFSCCFVPLMRNNYNKLWLTNFVTQFTKLGHIIFGTWVWLWITIYTVSWLRHLFSSLSVTYLFCKKISRIVNEDVVPQCLSCLDDPIIL